jgi:hypothetical protein
LKVDQRALAGIDRKIARADEHFRTLNREMEAWFTDGPYRLLPEEYDEGRKHFYRLKLPKPIPLDWAVIMGEAIHDLRSALDQCVYWLGVDSTRSEVPFSSFPVYNSKSAFYERDSKGAWTRRSGMNKIRGIGPGPQAFIEDLQPYPQRYRRFDCVAVGTMHDLWNQDKHRLVHLWGMHFKDEQFRFAQDIAADCVVSLKRGVLHDGAIVMTITCDPPHTEMEVRRKVTGKINGQPVIKGGNRAGGATLRPRDLHSAIAGVVQKLVGAIGHQDDPINA